MFAPAYVLIFVFAVNCGEVARLASPAVPRAFAARAAASVSTALPATLKTPAFRLSCVDESQCPIPGRSPVGAILLFRGGGAGFGCAGPRNSKIAPTGDRPGM